MSPILAERCKADFSHINALYDLEAAKPLKKANKLTCKLFMNFCCSFYSSTILLLYNMLLPTTYTGM